MQCETRDSPMECRWQLWFFIEAKTIFENIREYFDEKQNGEVF